VYAGPLDQICSLGTEKEDINQYIVLKIRNKNLQCLVDTGSVKSVISHKLACELKLKILPYKTETPLISASGSSLPVLGSVDVNFNLRGLSMVQRFIVIDHLFPNIILGANFFRKNSAIINYNDQTISVYDVITYIYMLRWLV